VIVHLIGRRQGHDRATKVAVMTTPPSRRDHSSRRPARRRGGADDADDPRVHAVTAVLAAPGEPVIVRLRPGTAVLLHLVPGVAALISYVALIPVAAALGLPSVAALAAAGLLAVPAVQLGILLARRRRHPVEPTMALRVRIRLPRLVGWAVLEIVLAGAVFVLTAPLTQLLQARVFGWWPRAWAIQLGTDGRYGDQALLITAVLLLLGSVLVAPMVEELYFRGFLLPRMPGRLGRWRIPAHVALFAAYHFWSPWLIPTRALAILPLAYVAQRTRDVRIGMVAHAVLNATDLVVLLAYVHTR
jgi:membrane protease YdiL (CAAX protease family)